MSDMIRAAWIRPAVEERLRQIIQWRSVDAPDRIKDGYQIIGDSVWVKMGGASPLQIIKFIAYEGEIEAWLSDAKSSIHAIFSFAALDAERAITGRRFTDETLGGIVGIEDYELRVRWPDTAPRPKLIMYVRRASYLGSGGEGIFGNPTYILSDRGIKDLMVTISTLELSDPEPMEDKAEVEPMVQSQGSDSQLDTRGLDGGGGGTQNEFATQVRQPRPAPSGRRTRAPHNSGSGVKQHDQVSVMTAMDVSDKVKQRAKANDLIRFLRPKRDTSRAVGVVQEVPKHLSIVPEEDTRRGADRKAAQASGPIPVLIVEAVSLVHPEGVAQIHARASGGTDGMESDLATGSAEGNRYISGAETGAVGGATTSQDVQTRLARGENLGADPWAGMTRISRREACIAEDQGELLSGKNCWIPPEPGNRAPVANIPVPILRALSTKAEKLAMGEREASEATKNRTEEGSQSESDSGSASDTGAEFEWPPSPVRPRCVVVDEMPVDSSPEGVSLANAKSQSGVAYQPSTQGKGAKSRRKREEILSDDQDSSPIVKRQRKGGYGEKESRSAQKSFRGLRSPRDRGVTPTSSPMDWRDVEEEVNPSTGGNADGRPTRAAELQGREHSSLHGVGKPAFEPTPDNTFSPIDEGTQASQHATSCTQANIVAMVEVERTETELEVDSSNYLKSPEHPEASVDAATEQVSRVINTQERSQTLDGKMDTDGEHELETSFPAALGDEADNVGHNANSVLSLQLPSTAPQIRKPVVQVKQTPHLYNQGPERSHRDGTLVSRGETGSPGLRNSVDSSNPVIPCTFPKTMVRVEIPVGARGHRLATGGGSRDSVLVSPQVETEIRQRHLQLHPSDKMDKKGYVNRRLETELGSHGLTQTGTLKGHDPKHLGSLAFQTSEPGVSSMSPSGAPASRPSRRDYAVSASASSHTPLKTLLSSPAHLKANVPSSILDWLEKTSSVGSDSVDNVSDPREQQWWHDRNTPFKEWCRAYVSLKSVNGAMGKVDRETGNIIPPPVQMDVLNWSLQ